MPFLLLAVTEAVSKRCGVRGLILADVATWPQLPDCPSLAHRRQRVAFRSQDTLRTRRIYFLVLLRLSGLGLFLGLPKGFEICPDVLHALLVQDLDYRPLALRGIDRQLDLAAIRVDCVRREQVHAFISGIVHFHRTIPHGYRHWNPPGMDGQYLFAPVEQLHAMKIGLEL